MLDDADAKTVSAFRRIRNVSLPANVVRNVATMMRMRRKTELGVGRHQRAIERVTELLGRPAALYAVLLVVIGWSVVNVVGLSLGLAMPDPPPFFWMQGIVGFAALLVASLVLVTQNRQAKLIERRMHLDLQVNLMTEQKVAKVIELLEELRRDLPDVRDRRDVEAEAMQHASQPLDVVAALDAQSLGVVRQRTDDDAHRAATDPEIAKPSEASGAARSPPRDARAR